MLAVIAELAVICVGLVSCGLPSSTLYLAAKQSDRRSTLAGNALLVCPLIAIPVVGTVALAHDMLADTFARGHGSGAVWLLGALLVPFLFAEWSFHSLLLGSQRFVRLNVLLSVSKALSLVLVGVLIGVAGLGVSGALLAGLGGSALAIGIGGKTVVPRWQPDLKLLRTGLAYGVRAQPGWLFEVAARRLDILILQAFVPLRVVGQYAVAQVIAETVLVVARAMRNTVNARTASEPEEIGCRASSHEAIRLTVLLTLAGAIGVGLVGSAFVKVVLGTDYAGSFTPMLILLLGMVGLSVGTVVGGDLRGRNRPGLASTLAAGVMATTVTLDFVLMPAFGATGAALASAFGYLAYGILSMVVLARVGALRPSFAQSRRPFAAGAP